MTGPTQAISTSEVPRSATTEVISAPSSLRRWSAPRISRMRSRANCLPHALHRTDRADPAEQIGGNLGREAVGRSTRDQVAKQRMQLVDKPGALGDDVVATLVEE